MVIVSRLNVGSTIWSVLVCCPLQIVVRVLIVAMCGSLASFATSMTTTWGTPQNITKVWSRSALNVTTIGKRRDGEPLMAGTSIEWATHVWNPSTGCDRVSPGCDNCYALKMAARLKAMGQAKYQRDGDPNTSGPGFGVSVHPNELTTPLRWRKPRLVFVNSMSDLFHPMVPTGFIAAVFVVMAAARQHRFQVLTKRHGRARSVLASTEFQDLMAGAARRMYYETKLPIPGDLGWSWPLPNVWMGVSVEDQKRADLRIPALLETPAAVRFLSCEPLLGPVSLARPDGEVNQGFRGGRCGTAPGSCGDNTCRTGIDWVIAGGESGPKARPMHPDWARSLRDQCTAAGVPFLFKQWGAWLPVAATYPKAIGMHPCGSFGGSIHYVQRPPMSVLPPGDWRIDEDGFTPVAKVGKTAAGRVLDGRTWDEYPRAVSA